MFIVGPVHTQDKSLDADLTPTQRSRLTQARTLRLMVNMDLSLSSIPL